MSAPGGGRNSNPLMSEKIVVFAPMPMASESTATSVNPGVFKSIRAAYRMFCHNVFIIHLTFHSWRSAIIGSTFVARLAET